MGVVSPPGELEHSGIVIAATPLAACGQDLLATTAALGSPGVTSDTC